VLVSFPEDLSEKAHATLQRLGVHIRTKTMATAIDDKGIEMKSSTGVEHWPTRTVLWAAGVKASPLSKSLASSSNADLDRAGRLIVEKDFSLAGRPEVFVLGDMSSYSHQGGKPLPGVAQPAIQQGRFVARLIDAKLRGRKLPEFHYRDLGNLATIGRSGGRHQGRPLLRLHRLVVVAGGPLDAHRQLPQPAAGAHAVVVELLHARPLGTADYRRRPIGRRSGGAAEPCRSAEGSTESGASPVSRRRNGAVDFYSEVARLSAAELRVRASAASLEQE
jgi:NADPH-dependent 2,4-dienoyl-CoA reductase/sulfur reductase-like enzyme